MINKPYKSNISEVAVKAWTGLILIALVVGYTPAPQAYSQSETLPTPDHPQLAIFLDSDQFVWLDKLALTNRAHDALGFIASAAIHGLDPEDYHLSLLQKLARQDNIELARYFDALLTDAVLDLIHDLAIGRLDPALADPDWYIERDEVDPAAILQQALLSPHLKNSLNQLIPRTSQYHQLTRTLSQYKSYLARGGWQRIPELPLLKPGHEHTNVPLVRARLSIEDATLSRQEYIDSTLYDERLVTAVKNFQKKHGLRVDGIIGSQTLTALNIPAQDMVNKIRVNLERFRWLPDDMGERYLLVNLGSYQLTAMENDHIKLNMKVIVGKVRRSTPSFSSAMTHIVINPYWNVPHSLARRDLLPKQKSNPDYFFLNDFNIYLRESGFQNQIDPYLINWDEISASDFPFRLQQRPGRLNALGRLKFMFPNPWNIYLHDTPDKTLFDEAQRNFSSGCIRVEEPLALAQFSLKQEDSRELLLSRIESGRNQGQRLSDPLPVYAVYFTVWPYQGEVFFSSDPYQRDNRMSKFL